MNKPGYDVRLVVYWGKPFNGITEQWMYQAIASGAGDALHGEGQTIEEALGELEHAFSHLVPR